MNVKYAIYKGDIGLYAVDYVDNMERLQDFMCRYGVHEEDLPIVVNRAGGRTGFYPVPENFVEIIEIDEEQEPLTREQMYPKNSPEFEYGWISPDGDTFNTGYEGHSDAADYISKEYGYGNYLGERNLEEKGWLKVTKSRDWSTGVYERAVFSETGYITKKQADTLFDLGLHEDWRVAPLIERSQDRW